jgi:hypothetical protein
MDKREIEPCIWVIISTDNRTLRACDSKEQAFGIVKALEKVRWGDGPYLVFECVRLIEKKKPKRKKVK